MNAIYANALASIVAWSAHTQPCLLESSVVLVNTYVILESGGAMESAVCGLQMALAAHHSLLFSRSEVNTAWVDQWQMHAERLVASACVDSIMFCDVWCALNTNGHAGVQRMCQDKAMFTQWTVHRYSQLPALDGSCVRSIVRQAVGQMEDKKPSDRVRQYTRYTADMLLTALGFPRMYYVSNPLVQTGDMGYLLDAKW